MNSGIPQSDPRGYDAIVIGSGFGGALSAYELVRAGLRVLMLERGAWVPRGPDNWAPKATVDLTPYYSAETPYRVVSGGQSPIMGAYSCVGGPSVFYGGVSLRLREGDFEGEPEIAGDSQARWPFGYAELEPYYCRAERLLNVAGDERHDPTEPYRSQPFPQAAPALAPAARLLEAAGRGLGLRPFPLPLAINFHQDNGRPACQHCSTCDTFACAVEAKNDLATGVLPDLIARGLTLRPETVAVRLVTRGRRVTAVSCFDKSSGRAVTYEADLFLVAAGALGSPHLLMASDLQALCPAGDAVGRYLTRHCNGMVFAWFPHLPGLAARFHKQIGFNDFYFGHASVGEPHGKLGSIQQMQAPPRYLVTANAPGVGRLVWPALPRVTGLLAMAEDQPRPENRLTLDRARRDRFGLPQLVVTHRHTPRDEAARGVLLRQARHILKTAGARVFYTHKIKTFSHAGGTVRAGEDPSSAPLDAFCRFRGTDNLFVVDASFMPTTGGVNPSLTIAANALRVGEAIARGTLPPADA